MTRTEAARKAGQVTTPKKAQAVRKNGRMPCAPGKVRGRRWKFAHLCSSTGVETKLPRGNCPTCGEAVPNKAR